MNDKIDGAASGATFQARVQPWMLACFGEMIAGDREERNHRFLEEALELVQSTGCTAGEAHQLVDYVYGRPVGEPAQEVGGVIVTLAALCIANELDMHAAAETELARIWTKVEQIRAKQAAKPKHSPLPATTPAIEAPPALSDAQIVSIWQGMPGGPDGWLKQFGFMQFARAVIAANQPAAAPAIQVQPSIIKTWVQRLNAVDPGLRKKAREEAKDAEIAELRAALVAKPAIAPDESTPLPDMLWDAEAPEDGPRGDGAADFARNYGENLMPGDEVEVTVLCATRAHNRRMLISAVRDEDDWLKWRWLDNPLPPDSDVSSTQGKSDIERCNHPECGRYRVGNRWECRAMADNACARHEQISSPARAQPIADAQLADARGETGGAS